MYLIPVEVRASAIHGRGVFATADIFSGRIVWKYEPSHDQALSPAEYDQLDAPARAELDRIAYLSTTSNQYIFPPAGDPAQYTNHSADNNLSVVLDPSISPEPFFVANRNIAAGEELTNNYIEFDAKVKPLEWL